MLAFPVFCIFIARMFLLCEGLSYRKYVGGNSSHFVPASNYDQCLGKSAFRPTYTKVPGMDVADCASRCHERESCGHFVLCTDPRSCYMEDDSGTDRCGLGCTSCTCFYHTVLTNVAFNALCQGSSEFNELYPSSAALDGVPAIAHVHSKWASRCEGVGVWIKIFFDKPHRLVYVRLMQRWNTLDRNKDVLFEFSDGSTQNFILPFVEREGAFWDHLDLQPVMTSWVLITIQSVYAADNSGFAEIELLSPVMDGSVRYTSAQCP